jgi:Protein of unknown function (DUF4238)
VTARRHHYVSQFYLKGFATERKGKPQVVVFDGKERKSFKTATDNVALEHDFNRVTIDGLEPDAFEKAMADFEAQVAPALERIIAAESLASEEDRAALLNLICAFATRNPRLRETTRQFHEDAATQIMNLALATPERWAAQRKKIAKGSELPEVSYEDMRKFVLQKEWKLNVPTTRHIQLELGSFDKLLPLFLDRKWLMVRASRTSGGFITSDHPVMLTWSDPEMRGGLYPPGFGLTGTMVLCPLCTHLAVVGTFEGKESVIDSHDVAIAGWNGAQIASAERQVFARDYNFKYSMQPDEAPRKASRLLDDRRFRKRKPDDESAEPTSTANG